MMWLAAPLASAQTYSFPSDATDAVEFYPTAYMDHAGDDWNCGYITYSGHDGSDFGVGGFPGMDEGRTVTAAADGTVVYTHDGEFDRCTTGACAGGGGFGNWVEIEHLDGKHTIYAHLKEFSVAVAVGDAVTCGQPIGEVGSSGYSTGPHLHFEVRNAAGVAEDPFDGPCSFPPTYWTDQGDYADLPGLLCADPPECAPVAAVACGQALEAKNDDPGSTTATWTYGCDEWLYSGPELSYTFTTAIGQPVTLALTGLAADLDLHVLDSPACDGTGCVAASSNPDATDESLTFEATAGVEYTLVIDGWDGAVSAFVLSVTCEPDPEDSGDTGSPTAEESPATVPPTGGSAANEAAAELAGTTGCGCSSPRAPLHGLPLLLVLGWTLAPFLLGESVHPARSPRGAGPASASGGGARRSRQAAARSSPFGNRILPG
jgi:Peptidase family M23